MKTALTGVTYLNPGVVCELYDIKFKNGIMMYLTTADFDFTYAGHSYLSGVLSLERSEISCSVGVDVDDVTITMYPDELDLLFEIPAVQFAKNGGFDQAYVTIKRARQSYVVHLFEGVISDVSQDRTRIDLTVSSSTLFFNTLMPRNQYLASCGNTLFDPVCGLGKAGYTNSYSIYTGSTNRQLKTVIIIPTVGYYDLGTITFTSGLNVGASRTINSCVSNNIYLSYKLDNVPQVGDTFDVSPGCDKRLTTCKNVFYNETRFRGFPFIPTPESSI